jgi:arylsulfatase
MCAHEDFLPTFAAAAGQTDIVDKLKAGCKLGDSSFKVHLDGHNLLPFLKGEEQKTPREGFLYWSDDGDLMAIRVHQWKVAFMEQENTGLAVWQREFTKLRAPKPYNIRTDPFERGPEGIYYGSWLAERMFLIVPAQAIAAKWLESFKDFPPRQKPASFSLSEVMDKMERSSANQN